MKSTAILSLAAFALAACQGDERAAQSESAERHEAVVSAGTPTSGPPAAQRSAAREQPTAQSRAAAGPGERAPSQHAKAQAAATERSQSADRSPLQEPVGQAQNALQQFGFEPGPVDGVMGPQTRAAVREFQKERGLPATGELNERTLQALYVPAAPSVASRHSGGGNASVGAGR